MKPNETKFDFLKEYLAGRFGTLAPKKLGNHTSCKAAVYPLGHEFVVRISKVYTDYDPSFADPLLHPETWRKYPNLPRLYLNKVEEIFMGNYCTDDYHIVVCERLSVLEKECWARSHDKTCECSLVKDISFVPIYEQTKECLGRVCYDTHCYNFGFRRDLTLVYFDIW